MRAARPLVGEERRERAGRVVRRGDRLQIRPLARAHAFAEERLVVAERAEVVAVDLARAHEGLVRGAAAVRVRAVLVDVAEEREATVAHGRVGDAARAVGAR